LADFLQNKNNFTVLFELADMISHISITMKRMTYGGNCTFTVVPPKQLFTIFGKLMTRTLFNFLTTLYVFVSTFTVLL